VSHFLPREDSDFWKRLPSPPFADDFVAEEVATFGVSSNPIPRPKKTSHRTPPPDCAQEGGGKPPPILPAPAKLAWLRRPADMARDL